MKVKEIKQLTPTECGICCILMILRYYKSKESMKEVQNDMDAGRDGTSLKQIREYLISKKMDTKLYKVSNISSISTIKLPCILYWNDSHFVVLEKVKNGIFFIVDPAEGRKSLNEIEFCEQFSSIAIQAVPSKHFSPKSVKEKSYWFTIVKKVFKEKKLIFLTMTSIFASYILTLCVPLVIKKILTLSSLGTDKIEYLYILILSLLMSFILISIYKGIKLTHLNLFLSTLLEKDTFKHLLDLPYKFFENRSTGDILYKLSSTAAVKELISSQIISGIVDLGSFIFLLIYMMISSVKLTIFSLMLLLINVIILLTFQSSIRKAIDIEIIEQSKAQSVQVETLYSIDAIKISGIEDIFMNKWDQLYSKGLKAFSKRFLITNINNTLVQTVQIFLPVIIFLFGIQEVNSGTMNIASLVVFQTIATTFFSNANSIFSSYTQFILANQYLVRVVDILETDKEKKSKKGIKKILSGKIELKNVSFAYSKNSIHALKNISLKVQPNQKVAFVGASGSGKSSTSKVMMGLYESTIGDVLFDDKKISEYDNQFFRKQIAIVPQNAVLFNKTIKENIILNNDISIDDLEEFCKIACIYDEIMEMPMQFNTLISEFGMNISGGQRQRILLARAIAQKPKIILLDETTSSLDSINEKKIMDYLQIIGCTVIYIAHRLSTIKNADVIFVFKGGEIIDHGTHDELIENSSDYFNLYKTSIS